jgi:16S rRNA (uracil1498-N3)-methyltransferase
VSRFYVPKESVKGKAIIITGEEAHHIIDVMRLKPSDAIVAFDGTGKEYAGLISSIANKSVVVDIVRVLEPKAGSVVRITLIQAIPKKAKMDYIVEKATELGAASIVPVFTERTIPDWDDEKRASCVRRWRKIALEASKQCSRSDIPAVSEIRSFSESLIDSSGCSLALIAALTDGTVGMRQAVAGFQGHSIAIAIGPEGDFTPREVKEARDAGFKPVNLGSRVLKSDTAGLAVLAILDYELTK